jgi:hypothetical protein
MTPVAAPEGPAKPETQRPDRVREAITKLLESFKDPGALDRLARHIIPGAGSIPCLRYSLLNRMIIMLSGTEDARGYRQWEGVGRQVRRGAKAIYILAPRFAKKKVIQRDEHGVEAEVERKILIGWASVPLFRVEETVGLPLKYEDVIPPTPPPLMDVAKRWGLDVKYAPFLGLDLGSYSPESREIVLRTWDVQTMFHELSHAADDRLGKLKPGQIPAQEIVAEFSAGVLASLYGLGGSGSCFDYVARYSSELDQDPIAACLHLIGRVERAVKLILEPAEPVHGAEFPGPVGQPSSTAVHDGQIS